VNDTRTLSKSMKKIILFGIALIVFACSSTGPVTTTQEDSHYPIVAAPKKFVSPLVQIETARHQTLEFEKKLKPKTKLDNKDWLNYASWAQSWDELEFEQNQLEQELAQTGEVELFSGRSYSFHLESYCVNGAVARPVTGDELKVAELNGPAKDWLPKILDEQGRRGVSQERVQYLIWALLYDTKFDELLEENQKTLMQFYPDAATRFGNRRLENFGETIGKEIINSTIPSEISKTIEEVTNIREQILNLKESYQDLEAILAPNSDRKAPIPVGWMSTPDGYLLRMTSESYSGVLVEIYVPEDESSLGRAPQAIKAVKKFRPSKWVGLPAQGQRVAVSTKPAKRQVREKQSDCERLKKWRPDNCHEMTDDDRKKIVALADPKKFSKTIYRQVPGGSQNIEIESDCSSFVSEIYRRAGYDMPFAPTAVISCLPIFSAGLINNFKAGDLILYPHHVGILDADGNVISATMGGELKVSMLSPSDPRFRPAIRKLTIKETTKSKPIGILKWRCP